MMFEEATIQQRARALISVNILQIGRGGWGRRQPLPRMFEVAMIQQSPVISVSILKPVGGGGGGGDEAHCPRCLSLEGTGTL